jgi:hypothetical protein
VDGVCFPSRGTHIQTHRLMEGIYEACRCDGLKYCDIHIKLHKDWLRQSCVNKKGKILADIQIARSSYKEKLHGLSPRANYTDRATAACRRSDCQLLRIEGAKWSA